MNEMTMNWDDLRLFLAVAREGGLAAASASTGKSAPTLGRRMLVLERKLNMELFVRMPRGYCLTEQGHALLSKVNELEMKVAPIEAGADGKNTPIVKISAGTWVTFLLCNHVEHIRDGGKVSLRFICADHVLDIGRREAVIGIRNRRPEQVGLAGRRMRRVRFATYALDKSVETWARVIGTTPSALWLKDNIGNMDSIEVTDARNALDLVLGGKARAVLPTFIGDCHDILEQVSPTIDALEHDQWLVIHHEDRFMPEVRRTIERIYLFLQQTIN